MKKHAYIILIAIFIIPFLYFLMAISFVLNFCNWRPREFEIIGFSFYYNEIDDIKRGDGKYPKLDKVPIIIVKEYDKSYYLTTSFFVRSGNTSLPIDFSLYPFGLKGYPGYVYVPGK